MSFDICNVSKGKYAIIQPSEYNSVDKDKPWAECVYYIQRCGYRAAKSLVTTSCNEQKYAKNPRHILSCYQSRKYEKKNLDMQQSSPA